MTEAEWLACEEPTPMLESVQGKVSNRKLRLFAVACCRHVWEWLPEHSRKAVEVAERYADKQASRRELTQARKDVDKDAVAAQYWDGSMSCGWHAAGWVLWDTVTGVVRSAAASPRTPQWLRVVNARRKTPAMRDAARRAAERSRRSQHRAFCHLLRDQFRPFRPATFDPAWRTSTVVALARGIYEERAFDRMPILADALQDAGCTSEDVLDHCRGPGPHARGCWVVDLVLGKE